MRQLTIVPAALTVRGLAEGGRPAQAQGPAARRDDRLDVSDSWREALFASALQPSDAPTAEATAEAIDSTVRQFGIGGCAGRMAQEFGDHPDAAVERMRWVCRLAAETRVVLDTGATTARRRRALGSVPGTAWQPSGHGFRRRLVRSRGTQADGTNA